MWDSTAELRCFVLPERPAGPENLSEPELELVTRDGSAWPIYHEADEPVFLSPWEGRVYAINWALGAWHKWNLAPRWYDIELLPPSDCLRMSYHEKWLAALENRVVKYGMVTNEELANGKPTPGSARAKPVFTVAMARAAEPRMLSETE